MGGSIEVVAADGRRIRLPAWFARTADELGRGLLGRSEIAADRAMVLDFGTTAPLVVTTVGMRFPIDLAFVGEGGHAVLLARDVPPDEPVGLRSAVARWVVELRAGTLARLGIDRRWTFVIPAV
jgi:uncharacterized membrane protein (UPF0127 family)